MARAFPPQSRTSRALRRTAGCPTQSNDQLTPPVHPSAPVTRPGPGGTISRIAATASDDEDFTSTDTSVPVGGIPMARAFPPQSRTSRALRRTAGCPTQSNDQLTPPVHPSAPVTRPGPGGTISRIAATASDDEASTKWVAPNCRASVSLEANVSTAMIRLAPASRSPWITLRPTPPTPNTAAVSPACTLARLSTAPTPVSTPQPMRQAEVMGTSLEILTAWTSLTIVDSANPDVAAKFDAGSPL